MTNGDVYCTKFNNIPTLCRPDKRSRPSIFPKWWCYNCKRYILPDGKYHKMFIVKE
jgi:hypothetical protein